jgi:hypothetical protein
MHGERAPGFEKHATLSLTAKDCEIFTVKGLCTPAQACINVVAKPRTIYPIILPDLEHGVQICGPLGRPVIGGAGKPPRFYPSLLLLRYLFTEQIQVRNGFGAPRQL